LAGRFEAAFWCPELETYALALDGHGEPCRVRTSNAGHCLFAQIAAPERAARVAAGLLDADLFSGWGVRTLAASERRYNPMSYHNGSVWPHDNALIAMGFANYGLRSAALELLNALFDASRHVELHRMPELMCGFTRRPDQGPTSYPLACTPQSWSAAAVFGMLQAVLGLSVSATRREIRFERPVLPPTLQELAIRDLEVAGARVDLVVSRRGESVVVSATRRAGDVQVLVAS
jgi:glycogen debranching enzyme